MGNGGMDMKKIITSIASVQITRSGADMVRTGTAELTEGLNHVYICGLTETADTDTARLNFPAGVSLQDLRFANEQDDDEEHESDRIRNTINALKEEIAVCELQKEMWKTNGDFSSRTQAVTAEIEAYITALAGRMQELQQKITSLNEEIKAKEKELKEAVKAEARPLVCADLVAEKSGTYPFELCVHENSAGWYPVYEIHTDAEKTMTVKLRARIHQNTEDDWENTKVSLLTGNPARSGSLPKLDPTYLSIRTETRTNTSARMSGMGMMKAMAAPMDYEEEATLEDTAALPIMNRLEMKSADISEEAVMTVYNLPAAKTIPSGGEGIMADLRSFDLPAEFKLIAVPMKDINAFLKADVDISALPTVITGEAKVYLNGIFTGNVYLDGKMTETKFEIPLGREESIQLSRTQKKAKASSALLKNQKSTEYDFEIRITNTKDTPVELTVTDRIPVSQDKTIIVETLQTDQADINEETGIMTWNLKLNAKETKTLHNSYRVSLPKDKQLTERTVSGNTICPECGSRVYGRFCPECGRAMY